MLLGGMSATVVVVVAPPGTVVADLGAVVGLVALEEVLCDLVV
jgi:hypothetical protein